MTTSWMKQSSLLLSLALLFGCGEDAPASRRPSGAREEAARFVPILGHVGWEAGPPLIYRRPTHELRNAEYAVEGHPEAILAISYFPPVQGGGGDVRENVSRWVEQFQRPPGSRPTVETRTVHELPVTTVEVRGTFVGRRGMGTGGPREGWRMLGAIVEGREGLVFFKLTGPEAGVEAAAAAFEALVESIHPE